MVQRWPTPKSPSSVSFPPRQTPSSISSPTRNGTSLSTVPALSAQQPAPSRIKAVGDIFTMNMEGDHMGGGSRPTTTSPATPTTPCSPGRPPPLHTNRPAGNGSGNSPPEGPDHTLVRHSYDWSKVTDPALLQKVEIPSGERRPNEGNLGQARRGRERVLISPPSGPQTAEPDSAAFATSPGSIQFSALCP